MIHKISGYLRVLKLQTQTAGHRYTQFLMTTPFPFLRFFSCPSFFFQSLSFCFEILLFSGTAVVCLWCNCKEIMALWHVSKIFPGYWSAGSVNRQGKTITTTKTSEKEEVDAWKEGRERPLLLSLNSWWLTILLVFA